MFVFFQNRLLLLFCSLIPLCSSASIPEYKTDVVVIGGGVGGLTSAIYLARGGVAPLVIEGKFPGGAIVQSEKVQNWPGDIEISGFDLIEKIRSQAEKNGAILSQEEMISIDVSSRPFSMIVQDVYDSTKKRKIIADVCIIATGTKTRFLEVPGEKKYESKGVYTCAVCDGPLYKNKVVAVVGGGDAAILEADYLSGIAKKVYLIVRGDALKGIEKTRREGLSKQENIEIIYKTEVKEIKGSENSVEKIVVQNKEKGRKEISVDAVFLAIGSIPNTQFFKGQIELDDKGYIISKNHLETSVPGVFAVGDVIDPIFKQAISAGGEGAKAAIQAQGYLSGYKKVALQTVAKEKPQGQVIEIKNLQQLQEIFKTTKTPILIDFYATWCSPCRYLTPFIDAWAKELQDKVLICKV
ncbi:MAG: FAD-dependent oxidoreductase, partial [Verrucomicrobia bacterium]|nr:FAD-dependent oxidoreductase [Verrucomicrobiota bacterium]